MNKQSNRHQTGKPWLERRYHDNKSIKKPDELQEMIQDPPEEVDSDLVDRIQGSMIGMALGDALGASVEFRPRQFLVDNPVKDLQGGGTWGLRKGQFTDDTSMALCLANSLIDRQDFVPYDQLVRYKWWFREGYMSSTGECFDIGSATKQSLIEFEHRQKVFARKYNIPVEQMDWLDNLDLLAEFDVYCSQEGVAGNGALMRLAPVPLFFQKHPLEAVAFSGFSGVISHGDRIAFDACRYYGALIVGAVHNLSKEQLLSDDFYFNYEGLFNSIPLHPEIMNVAQGSYRRKGGYDKGIRGKGYIVSALEAALWAFWSEDSFEKGALAAVNLGDDTDTTAAIYGQLAGAYYGYKALPQHWLKHLYAIEFIQCLSKWIVYEGNRWQPGVTCVATVPPITPQPQSNSANDSSFIHLENKTGQPTHLQASSSQTKAQRFSEQWCLTNQKNKSNPNASAQNTSSKGSSANLKSNTGAVQFNQTGASSTQLYNTAASSISETGSGSHRHSLHRWYSQYSSIPLYDNASVKSCEDVSRWLQSLGNEYAKYIDAFKSDFVDGFWLLNYIDDQQLLKKYGINNPQHRHVIIDQIQKLKGTLVMRF